MNSRTLSTVYAIVGLFTVGALGGGMSLYTGPITTLEQIAVFILGFVGWPLVWGIYVGLHLPS